MAKPGAPWARPGEVSDTSLGWRFTNPKFTEADQGAPVAAGPETRKVTLSMGETAEEVAVLDGLKRQECDEFALRSHQRAASATDTGRFAEEIVPVPVKDGDVSADEGPRRDTTLEKLGRLRPVFRRDGMVTAGSSSSLADGAAALVVAGEDAVRRYGMTPRARVVAHSSAGVAPHLMGLGPVPATEKVLAKAGLQVGDVGAVELNEAFAAQSLAVIRRLGLDEEKVNTDGGAIALGHPLGCSGARILVTLLRRMRHEDVRYGLASLCVGVGQGVAMLTEAA
jgi:acetyl-CoA acetyltransferase family protein